MYYRGITVNMLKLIITTCLAWTILVSAQGCAPAVVAGAAATGVVVSHSRRNSGTMVDDNSIELDIRSQIKSSNTLKNMVHITVTSYNLQVLLTGEAPTPDLRDKVLNLASNANNVRNVFNAINIAEPTAYSSRNNDSWISSKVKTRMLGKKEIDATRIKVLTENSSVFLMGLVTREEAETAATIASEVQGVRKVVKVFEYID